MLGLRQVLLLINSKTNLDITINLISKELKMKAKYQYFPIGHFDICSIFYTHATSPMRRFVDINVHNLIFNKHLKKYIYSNLDLESINKGVQVGKFIHQLVNNKRFIDFINYNTISNTRKISKKLILNTKLIDSNKEFSSIGFTDLATFYRFNTFNYIFEPYKKNHFILENDYFNIPYIKYANNDEKVFNLFFHMLKKENKNVRDKCQNFLEKIFYVKKLNKVC